jgi:phage gpG-like protein
MIKATLIGDDKLKTWLRGRYPAIQGELNRSMARLVIGLTRKVKQEKLSGQVLKNRTGTLRRSIAPNVISRGAVITGEVGTNIEYAKIHEFGGHTLPRIILPKAKKALMFNIGGKTIFAKKVNHPGSKMPERSFLRSALREMEPEIKAEFENAIFQVIGGKY